MTCTLMATTALTCGLAGAAKAQSAAAKYQDSLIAPPRPRRFRPPAPHGSDPAFPINRPRFTASAIPSSTPWKARETHGHWTKA
jgi:hypothetical protein